MPLPLSSASNEDGERGLASSGSSDADSLLLQLASELSDSMEGRVRRLSLSRLFCRRTFLCCGRWARGSPLEKPTTDIMALALMEQGVNEPERSGPDLLLWGA